MSQRKRIELGAHVYLQRALTETAHKRVKRRRAHETDDMYRDRIERYKELVVRKIVEAAADEVENDIRGGSKR